MLSGVIFDMDGVLVDSHRSHVRAWNGLLALFGRQLTGTEIELLRNGQKKKELMRSLLGDLNEGDTQKYGRQKDLLFQQEMKNIGLIAGVERFLRELSQASVPMAVASSGSRSRVRQTLESLRVESYFRAIVTGDDVATGKSDPEIFYKAVQQLQVDPIDVVIYEDSVSAIWTATAAGMKCAAIACGARAQDMVRAGAIAAFPDFTDVSYERMLRFLASKGKAPDKLSSADTFEQPPFAVLEDR